MKSSSVFQSFVSEVEEEDQTSSRLDGRFGAGELVGDEVAAGASSLRVPLFLLGNCEESGGVVVAVSSLFKWLLNRTTTRSNARLQLSKPPEVLFPFPPPGHPPASRHPQLSSDPQYQKSPAAARSATEGEASPRRGTFLAISRPESRVAVTSSTTLLIELETSASHKDLDASAASLISAFYYAFGFLTQSPA